MVSALSACLKLFSRSTRCTVSWEFNFTNTSVQTAEQAQNVSYRSRNRWTSRAHIDFDRFNGASVAGGLITVVDRNTCNTHVEQKQSFHKGVFCESGGVSARSCGPGASAHAKPMVHLLRAHPQQERSLGVWRRATIEAVTPGPTLRKNQKPNACRETPE